jgi:hypothetical protein
MIHRVEHDLWDLRPCGVIEEYKRWFSMERWKQWPDFFNGEARLLARRRCGIEDEGHSRPCAMSCWNTMPESLVRLSTK